MCSSMLQGLDGTMYVEAALAGMEKGKGELLQKDPLRADPLDDGRMAAPLGAPVLQEDPSQML